MATLVDERGRILVPKDLRLQFGLEPGCPVIIEGEADGIRVRRALSRQEALSRMAGAIPKDAKGPKLDPLATKSLWGAEP